MSFNGLLWSNIGPFHLMSAPPPPIEGQGNPKGREGIFKVVSEGVAMSVPLISRKHVPFSQGGNVSAL